MVKVRCYELPESPSWLCSLALSPVQHRAAVFQQRAWQIVHHSICSWDHPTAQLAVVLFILRISNFHISLLIARGCPKDTKSHGPQSICPRALEALQKEVDYS